MKMYTIENYFYQTLSYYKDKDGNFVLSGKPSRDCEKFVFHIPNKEKFWERILSDSFQSSKKKLTLEHRDITLVISYSIILMEYTFRFYKRKGTKLSYVIIPIRLGNLVSMSNEELT